mmetsp:Transcript_45196/g.118643  ORF Transcript_45196/g.118643 Transcript_45196/m.118643 type:complete len:283 (-) Transcript_45196:335-1183(-)
MAECNVSRVCSMACTCTATCRGCSQVQRSAEACSSVCRRTRCWSMRACSAAVLNSAPTPESAVMPGSAIAPVPPARQTPTPLSSQCSSSLAMQLTSSPPRLVRPSPLTSLFPSRSARADVAMSGWDASQYSSSSECSAVSSESTNGTVTAAVPLATEESASSYSSRCTCEPSTINGLPSATAFWRSANIASHTADASQQCSATSSSGVTNERRIHKRRAGDFPSAAAASKRTRSVCSTEGILSRSASCVASVDLPMHPVPEISTMRGTRSRWKADIMRKRRM